MKKVLLILIFAAGIISISAQDIYFPPKTGDEWETISPQNLNWCRERIDSLYHFLEEGNTKAFILLKDGKIVLEKYFGDFKQNSTWYWASAGKTITAFMVGLAQQEEFLSIEESSSKYLGEGWTNCSKEEEDKITIWHQLTMTTGLDDGAADPYCTLDTCLNCLAEPGLRWAYHNAPYTLLDKIIEGATGVTLNQFVNQKLKNSTGMKGFFVPVDFNNVYLSDARSMARFGLLILNKGNWDGDQIMTGQDYFEAMTNSSQSLNKSYGYLWWLNGKESFMLPGSQYVFNGSLTPAAPDDMFAALGKNGQFIDVVPSKNMVWIRMGDNPDNSAVPILFHNRIWDYLNELECESSTGEIEEKDVINIYPNPVHEALYINNTEEIQKFDIINIHGNIIIQNESLENNKININSLTNGIYYLKFYLKNGNIVYRKFQKRGL